MVDIRTVYQEEKDNKNDAMRHFFMIQFNQRGKDENIKKKI